MNNVLVSIVVPIYNMGNDIENCVQSLIRQDYPDIEILLVDDGSTDDSCAQCRRIASQHENVFVFHTENQGSGPARNFGISQAKGRYIYFPDADDWLEPNAISTLVDAMQDGVFDLTVFGFRSVNRAGKTISVKQYPDLAQKASLIRSSYSDYISTSSRYGIQGAPWNKFFDLELIKKEHIEFPPLRRHQDEGFIARYMCFARKVHFIDKVLYTYYVNDLKKEWQKYPADYIDNVIGLYKTRKETILTWNSQDISTHKIIAAEYISNIIKSLELSFSPKMKLNTVRRIKWIRENTFKSGIGEMECPDVLGRYQKLILRLIKAEHFILMYPILWLKVQLQALDLLKWIK